MEQTPSIFLDDGPDQNSKPNPLFYPEASKLVL